MLLQVWKRHILIQTIYSDFKRVVTRTITKQLALFHCWVSDLGKIHTFIPTWIKFSFPSMGHCAVLAILRLKSHTWLAGRHLGKVPSSVLPISVLSLPGLWNWGFLLKTACFLSSLPTAVVRTFWFSSGFSWCRREKTVVSSLALVRNCCLLPSHAI